MIIAVPYEKGEIFQHFGKAPKFKLYTVEDGKVVESVVVDTVGAGHAALADFLLNQNANIVIAGGIGNPAIIALSLNGIDVVPGISGDPDKAVQELIAGTLVPGEAACGCGCGDDHAHEGDTCGCGTQKGASGETCSTEEGAKGGCCCSTTKTDDKKVQ